MTDIDITYLYDLFEYLLVTNVSQLDLFAIKISEEMKEQLITILNKHRIIFSEIDWTLKRVLKDGKMDVNVVSELLDMIGKIYKELYESNNVKKQWNYYKLIRMILHISFVLYRHDRKIEDKETIDVLLKIVDSSIDLIQLKSGVKKRKLKFW